MRPLRDEEIKVTRGARMRKDPAREECFPVVQIHADLHDYPGMSPVSMRQRLHRHMHNEMLNVEITAQTLVDFPDAPWELRMQLARQCWDEVRHTQLVRRRLEAHGGAKGEFPVMNYEWGTVCFQDSLAARLTLQNRTFEAGEMDLFRQLMKDWTEAGDPDTAATYDGILADEIQHVRFANQALKQMTKSDPSVLLKVGRAIAYLKGVTQALSPDDGETNKVGVDLNGFTHLSVMPNVEDRALAEFSREEIVELLRREGFGPLVAEAGPADDAPAR
jgi:hypothetical protein